MSQAYAAALGRAWALSTLDPGRSAVLAAMRSSALPLASDFATVLRDVATTVPPPSEPGSTDQPSWVIGAAGAAVDGAMPAAGAVRFVTQTDQAGPWIDCAWASLSMLLQRATGTEHDRRSLRAASGDTVGGSTLADLARGARSVGYQLQWSGSDAGARDDMTFDQLLERLTRGGAVVNGTYANLPDRYTRWDRSFAARGAASGHSIYVDRYDPATDRVFIMDPLGRGDYAGEWMPAKDLRAFAWSDGKGHVIAAASARAGGAAGSPATKPDALAAFDRAAAGGAIPYAGLIRAAAVEEGVDPLLLASLIQAESSFRADSVSSAGAMGLCQLMPATARSLGVTDPFDPAQNIGGGAAYLARQLRRFGRTDEALAAYQAGPGAVAAAGGVPDFETTRHYVDRVLHRWSRWLKETA
jgi:hypothetical protein